MTNSIDLNKYIELYRDFLHPNPNINSQAFLILRKEFEVKFMNNLLANLKEEDLFIRRKSILALGMFGEKILKSIVPLYMDTNNTNVKVSCLKTMIKVVVNYDLQKFMSSKVPHYKTYASIFPSLQICLLHPFFLCSLHDKLKIGKRGSYLPSKPVKIPIEFHDDK